MMEDKDEKMGDKKFKAGLDNITTGLFQWSKDYASAASNFTEAVNCYLKAKKYDKVIKTIEKLIPCNEKLLDNWAIARNYETLLDIYLNKQQVDEQKIVETASQGFHYFKMAQSIDKGLVLLGQVAKYLTAKGKIEQGVDILRKAYKEALGDEKSFKKAEIFNQIVQIYCENEIYSELQKIYLEEINKLKGVDCCQLGLIILIFIIIQHQPKRAEKQMYDLSDIIQNFLQSDDCEVADELIKAYKKGDSEKFIKWTTKSAVTSIFPTVIIKKLRDTKIPSSPVQSQEKNQSVGQFLF